MSSTMKWDSTRLNKIYRAPPTPDIVSLQIKERSFILDGRAVSNISTDYSRANPKHGSVIPPYNSQKDKCATAYFKSRGIRSVLNKNDQKSPGTSIEGVVYEHFFETGAGARYLKPRNKHGCGYSLEETEGHLSNVVDRKDYRIGFNGKYGYRRNTPSLRKYPSSFGILTRTPLYD